MLFEFSYTFFCFRPFSGPFPMPKLDAIARLVLNFSGINLAQTGFNTLEKARKINTFCKNGKCCRGTQTIF